MSYALAQDFAEFKVPEDVKAAYYSGYIKSLAYAKMMLFAEKVKLSNENIDFFMALKPQRMGDETKEQLKMRSVFSKQLLKFRSKLYDYSVYNKTK